MAKRSKPPKPSCLVSAVAQKLFDRFPVARSEDAAAYDELVEAVMEALQPKDIIEEMLARDVVDHNWIIQRFRSIEAMLLTDGSAVPQQRSLGLRGHPNIDEIMEFGQAPVEVLARRPKDGKESARFVQEFAQQHPENYEKHLRKRSEGPQTLDEMIESGLSKHKPAQRPEPARPPEPAQQTVSGDDTHRLAVDAFKRNSREIDQIHRVIALSESRRNTALREFERYQAVRRARSSRDEILDAEYTEAPPPRQSRP